MSPSPAKIAELCLFAQSTVEGKLGALPDISEDSLAFIDHYLSTAYQDGGMKDEVLHLLASSLGAYFGEVIIGKFGGTWMVVDGGDRAAPADWRVQLEAAPVSLSPVGMVASAVRRGEAMGLDDELSVPLRLRSPLQAALQQAAEVSKEYYYSLTGRLETLGYIVELLAEIMYAENQEQASLQ